MVTSTCVVCKQKVNLTSPVELGKRVICQACSANLEVIWLYPVILDVAEDQTQIQEHEKSKPNTKRALR
jgi:lysine biosynthesis protein LysW